AALLDVLLCFGGVSSYFRSLMPVFRARVTHPASDTPVETWLDEPDDAWRLLFSPLRFRRLSETEVAFTERWPTWERRVPLLVAGRIREDANGEEEIIAGPRWLVWVICLWGLVASNPPEPKGLLVATGVLLSLLAIQYFRVRILEQALRDGPSHAGRAA
ncbi:MAG TPA: hypothetical protein VGC99_09240, partial [Candidatus Tectomicrobia bacterium]